MSTIQIHAGKLFDPYELKFVPDQVVTVSTDGYIVNIQSLAAVDLREDVVDLSHLTVLPGFVDAHVHMFLRPYDQASWYDQLTKESLVERSIRATVHAKKTLLAGFTTVRDLGTEGAADADITLRQCLSGRNAIIPGPRYFCANRAIVATGSYGPKGSLHLNSEGVEGVNGAEVADGPIECSRAVRRQVGAGADWIKIYADYRYRSRMLSVAPGVGAQSIPTFNQEELRCMIDTAHELGVKVAAHATSPRSVGLLLRLGVDSIEHATNIHEDDDLIQRFARTPETIWIPTLSVAYKLAQLDPASHQSNWENLKNAFHKAIRLDMENIACGGDTGAFNHGENALEMKLMVRLGAPYLKVLKWGTLGGWECTRPMDWHALRTVKSPQSLGDNEIPFGALQTGWAADIIAVGGDFDSDFEGAVDDVQFVMKAGKVYKLNGLEFSNP